MKKWQLVGSTTVLGTALLLGACGGAADKSDTKSEDKGTDTAAKDIKGEVNGDGSTTVAPVVEKINEQFATEYPDVTVSIGTSGTGGGFEKFIAGETDFSNASRDIKDEEKKALEDKKIEYTEFKIASDGLTVAVNKDNDFVDYLTFDELKKIYSGEAKTWKDVRADFPAEEIKAFSPDQSHGTYDFFSEEVLDKGEITAEKNADTNVIVKSVQDNKAGIGFFGYNFYQENKDNLKAVKIQKEGKEEGVEATEETVKDGSYPLSRPLFIYAKNDSLKSNEAFNTFMKFTLENAKDASKESGYVPLEDKVYEEDLKKLEEVK
ncbi:phosphate ABC transporter substrate-binding protein PstS family protein [Macrococcoides caseolyticum]|uniref:phosphate ABC transporter substrate-binding protein PstS family protein n=1 Tax=Macrococcoides caseolyticum TaxID=69966 RepID=UPI00105B5072|nr:phosphate ABC transporter substrate-binding protein PstS family protein [Macrococcus caseolyticus]MDJ1088271.1 phosphate ABC transporter substrate-binding protein PstS family protein [Macrococcus caseolyticus]MDJ1090936.1 phosphate ABC transporter substrate-binding protein PstS family protein [Macrococcus caseolyticus]MDJ1152457.1 phosphate ABC transporter substrate-binding protein PstS family protein [Macrococcus caseolyticus]MEB8171918.1 phosphate ABC transporter substrate-binding protein 